MDMTTFLNFDIQDNYIKTIRGDYQIYKISPPNFATLDEHDKDIIYNSFEDFMRTTANIDFSIFVQDKTVNLDQNRNYIKSLNNKISNDFEYIINDIYDSYNSIEITLGNTKRAYYIIIKENDDEKTEHFESLMLGGGFTFAKADKFELTEIMRCFLLREFIDAPIYVGEENIHEEE